MGVTALRRTRGWVVVKDNGEVLTLDYGEALTLKQVLENEIAGIDPPAVTPAKARFG